MNLSEEQLSRAAEKVAKKKDRIELLETLLATYESMGAQTTDSSGTSAAHGYPMTTIENFQLRYGKFAPLA
jgi:hypothetical protein